MREKIYIAGPYTNGDVAINVRKAFEIANEIADLGFAPFVPHSSHFWHMLFPREYEFWLELDNQFLPCCDALFRIPGISEGSDKEVELATKLGLPIFYKIEELNNYFSKSI